VIFSTSTSGKTQVRCGEAFGVQSSWCIVL
jgi:hypothetical protein